MPADIADELAKLQDRVPPFDGAIAIASIEKAFGLALADIFGSFEPAPLAAASIAQVHVATLKSGREVIVKILRPGMREIIDLDLEVLDYLAQSGRRVLGRGAPSAAGRAGARIPQNHSR